MSREDIETLQNAVQSWTAPVWFNQGLAALPETVTNSGSCGFVRSGASRFLITAWHVLEGFRATKRLHPGAVFAVNIGDGNTIALDKPVVIAEAPDIDVATIDFPHLDREIGRTTKSYFSLDTRPVVRAQVGEPATIVGFPGQGRRAFETFGVFEPFPIGMIVTNVSDRRIRLNDENDAVSFMRQGRVIEEGIALGGFSGSPAFGVTPDSIHLLGVVSEGSDRLGCRGFPGYVFLGPAEYLLPDGRFDEQRMGWR